MVKLGVIAASVVLMLCFGSCAFSPFTSKQTRNQQLIARAEQEVARRGLPLPAGHTADVSENESILEAPPYSRQYYVVTFYTPPSRGAARLYSLSFDRQTGTIDDFSDRRAETTPEEISAAKRAMVQHVGGSLEQFSTTSAPRGDMVEFTIFDLREGQHRTGHCYVRRKTLEVLSFRLLPRTI